jgi:hypothetical protein
MLCYAMLCYAMLCYVVHTRRQESHAVKQRRWKQEAVGSIGIALCTNLDYHIAIFLFGVDHQQR